METTPVISMEKIYVTFTSIKKTENSERWTLLPVSWTMKVMVGALGTILDLEVILKIRTTGLRT